MLSQIQRENGFANVIAVLTLAIHEVKKWFNVKNNINYDQEALTAELILDNPIFYDLTLGNIKACFRQKMMSEKLYDRLDGNIIIGWLREFKSEMSEHCENVNIGRERAKLREESKDAGAIPHAVYLAILESRANDGDKESIQILEDYKKRAELAKKTKDPRQERIDFLRWKAEYLKSGKL